MFIENGKQISRAPEERHMMPFICRSCGVGALSRKIYKHSAPLALPHKRIRQQNWKRCVPRRFPEEQIAGI
jgi:hypothetical protein